MRPRRRLVAGGVIAIAIFGTAGSAAPAPGAAEQTAPAPGAAEQTAPAPERPSAGAGCRRAVVFTLPGVTWADVAATRPPALLEAVSEGAAASMSVRTIASRTSYSSGYSTLGGGSRIDGGFVSGAPAEPGTPGGVFRRAVAAAGLAELTERANDAGYNARPGALASAMGSRPLIAVGNADPGMPAPTPGQLGRWVLYAAMNTDGIVELAASEPDLLERDRSAPFGVRTDAGAITAAVDRALEVPCASVIVDPGDLTRVDRYARALGRALPGDRRRALEDADELLGHIRAALDPQRDLLLITSPTSPAWAPEAHLGVAVAAGPGFASGTTLESASTRRRGVVTLPDVAPTVLEHLGLGRPPSMTGRPWVDASAGGVDRISSAIAFDKESVFVGAIQASVSTAYVIFQVVINLATIALLAWRERGGAHAAGGFLETALELAALAVVAFFPATYLLGIVDGHALGAVGFWLALLGLDAALVAMSALSLKAPLDRLLALTALTTIVISGDLFVGAGLQLNTVFGYSPIVAGRFAGLGNTGFAVLGAAAVATGALVVHRFNGSGPALAAVAALFAYVVIVDGAPQLGSDVGGVIALVPGLVVTWVLLAGRRPSLLLIAASALGAVLFLGAFLALDLARPPEAQTHLARLFEDVRDRGGAVLVDTVLRKAESNLRVFRTTIWTYFVPPGLAALGWLLARPRGRWARFAHAFPKLRAGLVGGLVLALLGFALNDSGIVIPAVILSFLIPLAVMVHLALEREETA